MTPTLKNQSQKKIKRLSTHVKFARKAFLKNVTFQRIRLFIQVKFHLSAKRVKKDSLIDQISLLMKRYTQMESHSSAVVANMSLAQKIT